MRDHLERATIALFKRVEDEAERAADLSGLADWRTRPRRSQRRRRAKKKPLTQWLCSTDRRSRSRGIKPSSTHNGRFGNPYGTSQLKRVRKNWLLNGPVLKMWVNGVDKYGTPLVAAIVPDGDIRDPDNPTNADGYDNLISNVEYMSRELANLRNGTGLAMAAGDREQSADIKFHGAGAGLGDAFERLILYLNKMIFRGMLVPSLVFDEG